MRFPPPILSALLISLILNFACANNKIDIDCNVTPENCNNQQGHTEIFEPPVYFHNVNVISFANNGEMIFKNPAYFTADNWDINNSFNGAIFANNGVMTFESNGMFGQLTNFGALNLNANIDMNFIDDSDYVAFAGYIFNQGIVNANGMIRFQSSDYGGIDNIGVFIINNYAEFEIPVYNYVENGYLGLFIINAPTTFESFIDNNSVGATFIIQSPTIIESYLNNFLGATIIIKAETSIANYFNNYDNATLEIKGTTLTVNNTLWNFRDATLIFSALNGELGKLVGDLTNQDNTGNNQGKVQVIVTGLTAGQQYQIVTGNATLDSKDISFVNGLGRYLGNGYVLIDEVFSVSTPIKVSYQANVSTMNNMFLQSNAIMNSNKHKAKFRKIANLKANHYDRLPRFAVAESRNDGVGGLDSLQSNESFFYNSDSLYLARAKAIKSVRKNSVKDKDSTHDSQTNPNDDKYSFLFTPFINHTYFYESGNYAISGLDGGFITAFSGKIGESNTLGTHFAFSYGSLSDKNDKDFKIASANLMLGLNYRLDLIYDMFLKARGDFYYFINEVGSNNIAKTNPNNVGFGLSLSYGKDFDFDKWGILGVELGLDYKMLNTSNVNVKYALDNSTIENYNKAFYSLLYLDFGVNYYKYFSTDMGLWGFDSGLGIRGNLTPKISNATLMVGNRSVDIALDNDNVLAYVNVGGSYVLQSTNFNMEFTLRYNGSFGDRAISNGGSFEWRVRF